MSHQYLIWTSLLTFVDLLDKCSTSLFFFVQSGMFKLSTPFPK